MGAFYKPYPKEFYAINDLLKEQSVHKLPPMVINTIDFTNRCVNYTAIDPARTRFTEEIAGNIIRYLEKHVDSVVAYIKDYFPEPQAEEPVRMIQEFAKKDPDSLTYEDKVELHYYLVDLYHYFPNNPNRHVDGILRKIETWLSKRDIRLRYATVDSLPAEECPFEKVPWVRMRFYGEHHERITIEIDQHGDDVKGEIYADEIVANQENLSILKNCQDWILSKEPGDDTRGIPTDEYNDKETSKIFFNYLFPLFIDPAFKADKEREGAEHLPGWPLIVMPIYSGELKQGYCGTVMGHLNILFDNIAARNAFCNEIDTAWNSGLVLIPRTLLEGRAHMIGERDFRFHDGLKDFLDSITHVQDWERIMVFGGSEDGEPLYCFKRFPGKEKGQQVWNICENQGNCKACENGLSLGLIEALHDCSGKKQSPSSQTRNTYHEPVHDTWFFFQSIDEILDTKILPSIENGDIARYKNYVLCFQFPECTFYRTDNTSKENAVRKLGEHYTDKLIPVFDRLLLKKKLSQNSIRSAVSAIIGRNMSHNIGSHVLSYGPASLKTADGTISQVRFYAYLRQRMDFIAEICTANPSWHSSMNLIRDVLVPFFRQDVLLNCIALSEGVHRDECDDKDCSKNHHNIKFKVIIGGKTCFEAKSEHFYPYTEFSYKLNNEGQFIPENHFFRDKDPEPLIIKNDITVSIPHGIIGCHAFYSILENLIRNSAKHGISRLKKRKALDIILSADDRSLDLIKLDIADNVGNCNYQLKIQLSSGLDPLKEPLVDNEGRLNSRNLGLKEMRVCANFLRMRPTNQVDVKNDHGSLWPNDSAKKPLIELDCGKKICSQDHPCKKPNLQYALYLFKPKESLIIFSNEKMKKLKKKNLDHLQKHGIYFKDIDSFQSTHERSFFHRFLAVQHDLWDDLMNYVKSQDYQIPLRVVAINETEIISVENLYEKWIKEINPKPDNLRVAWRASHSGGINDIFCTKNNYIPPDTNIIFDNHGECNEEGSRWIYYQPYRGDERIYRLLYTIAGEKNSQRLRYYELIEASITNVIIADERIWKKTEGDLHFGPKLTRAKREVLNDMRIRLIPIKDNSVSLKSVKQFLTNTEKKVPCFLIMHQGIIDKMNDGEQRQFDKIIADQQKRLHHFTYVVTSGRGFPNFPQIAKFFEISNLEKLIEERDKYSLVQTLFALRRPENE